MKKSECLQQFSKLDSSTEDKYDLTFNNMQADEIIIECLKSWDKGDHDIENNVQDSSNIEGILMTYEHLIEVSSKQEKIQLSDKMIKHIPTLKRADMLLLRPEMLETDKDLNKSQLDLKMSLRSLYTHFKQINKH